MQPEELVGKLTASYDDIEHVPKRVLLFEINVQNSDDIDNVKLLTNRLSTLASLKKYFNDADYSYSSSYINYHGAGEIAPQLYTSFAAEYPEYKETKSSFKDFLSIEGKIVEQANNYVMNTVTVNYNELNYLDYYLSENMENLVKATSNSYLVCILFKLPEFKSVDEQILINVHPSHKERLLQETPAAAAAETEEEEGENGAAAAGTPINITPNGLSGILVALLLTFVLIIAVTNLNSIQTPANFVKNPLVLGREQI
jgi:hypothetical protein